MYALYKKELSGKGKTRYELRENSVSLFGCKSGFIPWLLQLKLRPDESEPLKWHVDVPSELGGQTEYLGCTLVIDLKPKKGKTNLSLYELLDVWGYTRYGWTPMMLRLRGLFVDQPPSRIDRKCFETKDSQISGPMYEFTYTIGTVSEGKLVDKWVAPPASPTNGALLWPDALSFFVESIRQRTPEVFAAGKLKTR